MTRHSAAQQLVEARQIAKDHGLVLSEKSDAPGKTRYLLYRKLPNGQVAYIGQRCDVDPLEKRGLS